MNISLINAESRFEVLCRTYVCAVFDVLRLRIQSGADVQATQLVWAVGVLSDHKPHFLGAWLVHDAKDAWWSAIAGDLQDRGVERLRIAIGPDPVEIQAAMAPRYRNNAVLPRTAAMAHSSIESTLSGHRPYIEQALEVTSSLSLRLKRAASRNGPFANAAAAAALLRRSAERCIYRDWREPSETMRAQRSPVSVTLAAAAC